MKLPVKADALIFDLDGTLLDTEPLYTDATQRVLDPYGHTFTPALKRKVMGGDSRKSAEITLNAFGMDMTPETFLTERERHLVDLFPHAAEIEGSDEFLTVAHQHGQVLGLATSSHSHLCELKIGQRRWRSYFQQVVCGDDKHLENSKPAPDIFLLCADRLDISPGRVIAFEDSRNGVLAAKAAGMTVIAIDNEYVGSGDLDDADYVIGSYRELL